MKIDEWIEKAKLNAKVNVEYPTDEMLLQEAEEYAQLADWLEELKDHRERECNHIDEALYDKCYLEGYNKAIDDFIRKCEIESRVSSDEITHLSYYGLSMRELQRIAEQLREGVEDVNNE